MKKNSVTMLFAAVWAVVLGGVVVQGQDTVIDVILRPEVFATVWKAELDTTDDWFDETLWTEGVPDATLPAFLVNGSETLLDEGAAEVFSLSMTSPSYGRSRLTQTGGSLEVEHSVSISDGIYRLVGGRLAAESLDVGQLWSFFLLPDLTDVPKPEVSCHDDGNGICVPDLVLFASEKRFLLEGGEATFAGEVRVGQGQIEILGGRMQAGGMFVDGAGWSNSNPEVNQRGGVVNIDGDVKIQDGTYALSGGTLTVERLVMGDPAMDSPRFLIWPIIRSPEFLQTGGEVQVRGNLELCEPGFIQPLPTGPAFTDVTYRLQAGSIIVGGDTVVGSLGVAPARFLQSGGTHRTAGTLRIEGVESRYELSGGSLHVDRLAVGTDVFNEGGTFSIAAGAEIVVDSQMTFGALAIVEATPNARIQLGGGNVEILGSDAGLLAGLENVSLLVTGDETWSTLEAASADRGADRASFTENFAWAELLVGNADESAQLRLVDTYENHSGTEAVYVDRLIVAAGSSLDLNGLRIYYREAEIAGQIIMSGGALLAVVPEPTTFTLVSMMLVSVVVFRGRPSFVGDCGGVMRERARETAVRALSARAQPAKPPAN